MSKTLLPATGGADRIRLNFLDRQPLRNIFEGFIFESYRPV